MMKKFFNWDHNPTPVTVGLSEILGYPCCSNPDAAVLLHLPDKYSQWEYWKQ